MGSLGSWGACVVDVDVWRAALATWSLLGRGGVAVNESVGAIV